MKTQTLPLTPQEKAVIDEAWAPFMQAVTIVAKLRGLNTGNVQLTADRTAFVVAVPDEVPANRLEEALMNGAKALG